jgi:fibronectin type 3 domain-containing protein
MVRSLGASSMDQNRLPKLLYYAYQAAWTPYSIKPVVKLAGHWNWNVSGNVQVNAFSNCPAVRLLVNGVQQGAIEAPNPWSSNDESNQTQTATQIPFQTSWQVPFAAGTVTAQGLDAAGNVVATDSLTTAGAESKIVLSVVPELSKPDGTNFQITANGSDAAFVTATIEDANGNWEPLASDNITFSVSGPATYMGGTQQYLSTNTDAYSNANSTYVNGVPDAMYHSPGDPELQAEGGMTRVAVRSQFTPGTVTVTATAPGLASGSATFNIAAVPDPRSAPTNICSSVPSAPVGLAATVASSSTISLTWNPVSPPTNCSILRYSVYRSTTSGFTPSASNLVTNNVTGSSYDDTGLAGSTTYYYVVEAVDSYGTSAASGKVSATTPAGSVPSAPTGLAASSGNALVTLSWAAVSGATSYNVYRGTASGGEGATPISTGLTGASYADSAVTNGTTYYYTVAAVNANGTSGMSNEVASTPSSATDIVAINCGGSAAGAFVADTDVTGGASSAVTTSIDTTGISNPAPQAVYQSNRYGTFTYTIPGLTSGTSYTVRLHFAETYWTATGKRVFNVSINGTNVLTNFDIVAAAGAANKANVQQFTATANSNGQITITTTAVTDNPQINGIEVLGASQTCNSVPPTGPTSLTASAANSSTINLSWPAGFANPPCTVNSYNIFRSTTNGFAPSASTQIASGVTGTTYSDTGLSASTTYYYLVESVDSFGASAASPQASATTSSSGGSSGGVSINCGGAAASPFVADVDFTGGATASVTNTIDTSLLTGTVPPQAVLQSNRYGSFTYTIPNLTAGTSYPVTLYFAEEYWTASGKRTFNVSINGTNVLTNFDIYATAGAAFKAVQKSFTATANSSGQIVITTTNVTDNAQINGIVIGSGSGGGGSAPAAPTGLSATAGNSQVNLSWTASSGATSYNVYRGTTAGGESTTAITTGLTGTSYTDTGLTNGTTYYYTVAALNSSGTSGMSNETSATPVSNTGSGGVSINCGGVAASPFVADVDFTGGATASVTNTIDTSLLTGTVPPQAVLQSNRYGSFTYTIPNLTANASYPVSLYFAEEYWTASGKRTFNVSINGTNVLTNFDIYATAGAAFKAVQKSFTATADSAGQIVITTTNVTDNAQINGIVVGSGSGGGGSAPAAPTGLSATAGNSQVSLSWTASSGATSYNVYRGTTAGGESTTAIATGVTGTAYTNTGLTNGTTYYYKVAAVNSSGTSAMSNEASATPQAATTIAINSGGAATGSWVADTDFSGGGSTTWTTSVDTSLLSGTVPPQAVLQCDREGTFTYTIPGLTAGSSHTVTLYFVEQYWTATGKRVFSVTANGTAELTNFDIYATAAAANKAVQKSFTITANSSGQIVLQFTPSVDQAKCGAIVVQ